MPEVVLRKRPTRAVTMAKASLNNGQTLYGVNDLFIGPRHIARPAISFAVGSERDAIIDGVIVSTGMGSTGWLKSLLTGAAAITQSAGSALTLQATEDLFTPSLEKKRQWKVALERKDRLRLGRRLPVLHRARPFPTKTTGASLVFGASILKRH